MPASTRPGNHPENRGGEGERGGVEGSTCPPSLPRCLGGVAVRSLPAKESDQPQTQSTGVCSDILYCKFMFRMFNDQDALLECPMRKGSDGTSYWVEQRPAGSMLEDHALEPFDHVGLT